jgi:hypothetical protein
MLVGLPLLLLVIAPTSCDGARFDAGNVVPLAGTAHGVVVPRGWWLRASSLSPSPSLSFELPHACSGPVRARPELSVMRMDGVNRPASLDEAAQKARASGDALTEAPVRAKIAGNDAIEYAVTDRLLAHYVGGGGSFRPLYLRVVVMQLGSEFFECWLSEDVIGDEKLHAAPRRLCASLARSDAAQRDVP